MATRTIRNCDRVRRVKLAFTCPRVWEELSPTGEQNVSFCAECEERVYFCATDEETIAHARAGHCIAREQPDRGELPPIVLGRPAPPIPEPTPEQQRALAQMGRERGIDEVLASDPGGCPSDCSECGYPVPRWRKTCYVCGHGVRG